MDPFSVLCYKYIKHLAPHYEFIHYGRPGSTVDCLHVDITAEGIEGFNKQAGEEIAKRKKPGDLIICFYGTDNKPACDMNPDLITVEPSIGYVPGAVFSPYRVFTSYSQMHMFYGERGMLMNPSWFDEVIPNGFTPSEFTYREDKEDFYLYYGRVCKEKGVDIAIQATERIGARLVIAGPGSLSDIGYSSIPKHVEMLGLCDAEQRRSLMSRTKAVLAPTYYVEPFGNIVIEANLSGTPAITSDWGGFTENVIHGKTGWRCRDFNSFVDALELVLDFVRPIDCYNHGMNYADELIHQRHDLYLRKIIKGTFY
jgi:glycosyltransferase involved in cell wall biosynthesis